MEISSRKSFRWSRPPEFGESLLGFIARNLDLHGVNRVDDAFYHVGLEKGRKYSIRTVPTNMDVAPSLAALFRTAPEEITRRAHPFVRSTALNKYVDFFGTPIRSTFLGNARRCSPRSLRIAPYHRALWDLRPLRFCLESRERLIATCPAPGCGCPLGWRWTLGPCHCENCGADLREYPQPLDPCSDPDALEVAVGLVNPDDGRRRRALSSVATAFKECSGGDLFEFTVMLANALAQDIAGRLTAVRRFRSEADFGRLDAQGMAGAARIIVDWPSTLHRFTEELRAGAEDRHGVYGTRKELGPLADLLLDPRLPASVEPVLRAGLELDMAKAPTPLRQGKPRESRDWISSAVAATEFKIHKKAIRRLYVGGHLEAKRADNRRSPVMVEIARMREIVEACADACTVAEAARLVGVDDPDELVSCGLLRKATAGVEVVYLSPRISRKSVDELKAAIAKHAGHRSDEALSPARNVVYGLGFLDLSWAAVLEAARSGRLPVMMRGRSPAGSLVDEMLIADDDATRQLLLSFRRKAAEGASFFLSNVETSRFLGISSNEVTRLAAAGYLTAQGDKKWHRHLTRESVQAFRSRYMLTGEVGKLAGCGPRAARARMDRSGLVPICTLNGNQVAVWDRREVARVLAYALPCDVGRLQIDRRQNGSAPPP